MQKFLKKPKVGLLIALVVIGMGYVVYQALPFLSLAVDALTSSDVAMNEEYELSFVEITRLEEKAKQGDAEAALALSDHYAMAGEGSSRDMQKADSWNLYAAEKGHPRAQHNAGVYFLRIGNKAKARYWFEKSAKQAWDGSEQALQELRNLSKEIKS